MKLLDFGYSYRDCEKDWLGNKIRGPHIRCALSPLFTVRHVDTNTAIRCILSRWRMDLCRYWMVLGRIPYPAWGSPLDEALQSLGEAGGDWYSSGGGHCTVALCYFDAGPYREFMRRAQGRDQPTTESTAVAVWTACSTALRLNGFRITRKPCYWRIPPHPDLEGW